MNSPVKKHAFAALLLLTPLTLGHGQSTWDYGANPDKNWSTFSNWDTDLTPAGTAVAFGAAGTVASNSTATNTVDQNFSITSLTYGHTSATNYQVTQIVSPQTLTVAGAFRVGTTQAGAGLITLAAMTGTGTFAVNDVTSSFTVASSSGTGTASRATLDMSNLATFTANVLNFNVGTGNTGFGTLFLADNSTITTPTLNTGGSGSSYGTGVSNTTYFGTTTTLNVDNFAFGGNRTYGTAQFRPASSGAANTSAVSNGTVTIRGSTGGSSRVATMTVGAFNGSIGGSTASSLNFNGGSVNALVTALTIGSSSTSLASGTSPNASLSMSEGSFDATTVVLGQTTTNNGTTASMTGTLNVSGGTFTAGTMTLASNGAGAANTRAALGNLNVSGTGTVNVTTDLLMGVRSGAAAATPKTDVSAGSLTVGGNMAEGAGGANIASTVLLSGGTIDMTRGTVAVDTFTFSGGTLKNVATFNPSTAGNLALQDGASTKTLGFDFVNSGSNSMSLTLTGGLTIGTNSDLGLSLANGVSLTLNSAYNLVANDAGEAISGTFGTVNGGAFGLGNTFSLTNNTGTYGMQLFYDGEGLATGGGNDLVFQVVAVPEPSTCLLLGVGFAAVLWRRRRA